MNSWVGPPVFYLFIFLHSYVDQSVTHVKYLYESKKTNNLYKGI